VKLDGVDDCGYEEPVEGVPIDMYYLPPRKGNYSRYLTGAEFLILQYRIWLVQGSN
jgi:hypothetical protein